MIAIFYRFLGAIALIVGLSLSVGACAKGEQMDGQTEPQPDPNPIPNPEPMPNPDPEGPICGDGECADIEIETCPEDCGEDDKCEVDDDCGEGICEDGECVVAECVEDVDCPAPGSVCEAGRCVPGQAPRILSFTLTPDLVVEGERATLAWETEGANAVRIEAEPPELGVGNVDLSGSAQVDGLRSATYRLVVSNASGEVSDELDLVVAPRLLIVSPDENGFEDAAVVGQPFEARLLAEGGQGGNVWTLQGTLPTGLSFDANEALIEGTALEEGEFALTVGVRDSGTPMQEASRDFTLRVVPGPLSVVTETMPATVVGTNYNQSMIASGGSPSYTWAVVEGALPAGLTLDPSGTVSGSAETHGTFEFVVEVTDSADRTARGDVSLDVAPPPLVLSVDALPTGRIGQAYEATLTAEGGAAPYTFSSPVLPPGLVIQDNQILGTPEATFDGSIQMTVTDDLGTETTDNIRLIIFPALLEVVTAALPDARLGEDYSATLESSGGREPVMWSVEGLPGGVSLTLQGVLSGRPTAIGEFAVRVTARSADQQESSRTLSLTVAPPELVVVTDALPNGRVGEPYSVTLEADGGLPPLGWAQVAPMPEGLALNQSGVLSGTPQTAGTFTVEAAVSDDANQTELLTLSLLILPSAVEIVTDTLPAGRVGESYSAVLEGAGGEAPYTWSVFDGALPAGVSISPGGALSGTPSNAETANFTVQIEDSAGQTATAELSMVIAAEPPRIATEALALGRVGETFVAQLEGVDGAPPYTWDVVSGDLPAGMELRPDGLLTGVPEVSGTFVFTARLTDDLGEEATRELTLEIAPGPLSLETVLLPGGQVGRAYSASLEAIGGLPPYDWSITAGALPAGLDLDPAGSIFGSPSEEGTFQITVEVADQSDPVQRGSRALMIAIAPAAVQYASVAGSFVDISTTAGAPLSVSTEDDGNSEAIPLGFDFVFFGQTHSEIFVSSNGLVTFGLRPTSTVTNTVLPSTAGPENIIAVFWDDLDPGDAGEVFMEVRGSAPFRRAIVQWKDVDFFTGSNSKINAQAILYETTNQVQLLYGVSAQGELNPGRALGEQASFGIENADGTSGVQIAVNESGAVLPGDVFLLSPDGNSYTLEGWNTVDGDFVDISATGTQATSINGDDTAQRVPIGFDFDFFGQAHTEVSLSSNGYMTFIDASATAFSNVTMPSVAAPNAVVAPFWDDLHPTTEDADGGVFFQVLGAAPNRRFVAQWHRVRRVGDLGARLSFQAVLHETTQHVSFHYGPMIHTSTLGDQGSSATVGIENSDGTAGALLSFNTASIRQGASAYFMPASNADTNTYAAAGLSDHFVDISREGTLLDALSNQDDLTALVPLGFDFDFDGQTFGEIRVSTNGWLRFGGVSTTSGFSNADMPNASEPNGVLAPFWDDLDLRDGDSRGQIFTMLRGTAPAREFVVQWQGVPHNADLTASLTFQVVLRESDGSALFNYGGLVGGSGQFHTLSSATVGVENLDGTAGSAHSFNKAGAVRSGGQVRIEALR